ncbi:MAG: hydrogenase iron-sulfur subunit [Candidatus Alcyoniella australis]|nr:hydrogenase iron-sulfur subunit [Candidatus Alcyoniella australis]
MSERKFEPKVLALCCTYCAYTAADLAGSLRLEYSPNVRVVKLMCSGKVDPILLLRAFERGADAVFVAGCAQGECHFLEGNVRGKRAVQHAKRLIAELGLEPERLEFFHIPASDGPLFARCADQMTARARELGPNPLRSSAQQDAGSALEQPRDAHPALPQCRAGVLIRAAEGDE